MDSVASPKIDYEMMLCVLTAGTDPLRHSVNCAHSAAGEFVKGVRRGKLATAKAAAEAISWSIVN